MSLLPSHLLRAPAGALFVPVADPVAPRRGGVRIVGHKGGKGGGGSRAPVESPDSLHSIAYAKVLDIVSEGPIVGPVHGLSGLLRDIYLDGTPVQNEDGSLNFQGVTADFRAGTQTQDYIQGFPASESTAGVNVELTSAQPFVRQVTNTELSAVRITLEVRGLSQANTSNGDISGYRVEYAVDLQIDGGAFQQVLLSAFDGKTTQTYARTHRIDLPEASSGWTIRVRRITANANSSTIADTTFVQSITEVIDVKLRRPMTAVVGVQVDASQFQSVPTRAYRFRGRIVSVPSNYDPETRSYSGTWDGTFKQAYTNCPPWIFYDMVSNDRYGLGAFIPSAKLSALKWALYPIAQYCDELVPDGFGGMEPRFTCNVYLQQAGDAWRVLSDLASVFRGMVYEQGGSVMAAADMPSEPAYTYSSANIIDGLVTYAGSPRRTRYTVAQVSWNDLSDMGRAKVEAVEDREAQARLGLRITQITAFGCTSRGQALRVGKWALLTSQRETQTMQFRVGMDHAVVAPGKVVRLADPARAGRRISGRIREATDTVITTDAEVGVRPGDRLVVNLPSGVSESRIISDAVGQGLTMDSTEWTMDSTELTMDMVGLPGSTLTITVTQPFSETPEPEAIWSVESEQLSAQLVRVLSIARQDGLVAEISGVQHEPGKYPNVDFGTKIDPVPITVIPPSVQAPPASVTLTSYSVVDQGVARHNAVIRWDPAASAVAYQVQWRRDNSDWIEGGRVGSTSLELADIRAGAYLARVRAINAAKIPSVWTTSAETQLEGSVAPPPALVSLAATSLVMGIRLDWGFPDGPSIVERTEVWYSNANNRDQAIKLGDFAYPQNTHTLMGLAIGARLYFWARLIDKYGEPGPWYPSGTTGVVGTASSDASLILDYIQGKISRDQLAQALVTEIDKIPGIESAVTGVASAVQQETQARQTADGALASSIEDVQATANGALAAVQTASQAVSDLDGKLSATYAIKAQITQDGKVYAAGMGLGAYTDGSGVPQTSVYFLADRLALLNLVNGSITTPFVIENGVAILRSAVIGNATINAAKFTDWLESDATGPGGTPVLRLNFRTGRIEQNAPITGGGRKSSTNDADLWYDENNTLRIELGRLA